MTKSFNIDTKYLHTDPNFTLAPKGQEVNIEFEKCNFYTDRAEGSSPQYITQSYSVGDLEHSLSKMILPEGGDISTLRGPGVSVHYLIDKDGTTYHLVPDDKKPWAVGVGALKTGSKLNPIIDNDLKNDMNNFCISIMSINNGKEPLTAAQLEANIGLTKHLAETHHINPQNVIGLGDWAVGRHIAPGPYFPWEEFSKADLGLWSNVKRMENPEIIVSYKEKPLPEDVEHIQQALVELEAKLTSGLGLVSPKADIQDLTLAFNLHHLGQQIINSQELREVYNNRLWVNSSDTIAKGVLSTWDSNGQAVLDDLLDTPIIGGSDIEGY